MSKIASKTMAVIVALFLLAGVALGGTFLQAFSTANAQITSEPTIQTKVTDRVAYGESFTVAGATGYTVTVKTPGNTEIVSDSTESTITVPANQVGIYEVIYNYTGDNQGYVNYTYNVECYMDLEYKFVVDDHGASIPTYWKKDGKAVTLPDATLYYLDEDTDKYLPVAASEYTLTCEVTGPTSAEFTEEQLAGGTATITPSAVGTYFITYVAKVGSTGENVYTEQYTMQVQDEFLDERAPTLTISGVPSSSSLNTSVSLPTATVTDDYDSRVNTYITVTHTYGNSESESQAIEVPEVVIDEDTGYAKLDENGNILYYKAADADREEYSYDANNELETTTNVNESVKAKFDNTDFMSFIPTEEGTYRVTYQAEDSTGKYDEKTANRTATYSYNITVSDTTAPVYRDIDSSLMPSTWGNRVYKHDATKTEDQSATEDIGNTDIGFPVPVVYDNSSRDADVKVSFTLSDKNSKTVIRFTNINATVASSDNSYAASDVYGVEGRTYYFFRYWENTAYTIDEATGKLSGEGLGDNAYSLVYFDTDEGRITKGYFNFNNYTETDKYGDYTVTYRASDANGNSSSRTFNITYQASFTDTSYPVLGFDTPDYAAFRAEETEVSVSGVTASDSNDSRLDVTYFLVTKFDRSTEGFVAADNSYSYDVLTASIDDMIDGGSAIELDPTAGTTTLTLEKDGTDYNITTDNVYGLERTITLGSADLAKGAYFAMRAIDSVGNETTMVKYVELVDGTADADAADYLDFQSAFTAQVTAEGQNDGNAGTEYTLGNFTINYGAASLRDYTGFEMYVQRVQDAEGNEVDNAPLTNVTFDTYSDNRTDNGTNKIYVENIRFTPNRAGTYMIVIRAFGISGQSQVHMFFRTFGGESSGMVDTSASLPDTMQYNQTYKLPNNYKMPAEWGEGGVLRTISGGRFTLMGTEFTAKSATTFRFTDYVFKYDYTTGDTGSIGSLVGPDSVREERGTVYSGVTDGQNATFRLLGAMPTYVEKDEFVVLPNVSASSSNGNATNVTLSVTDPDGNSVNVYDSEDTLPEGVPADTTLVGNQFGFFANTSGSYELTYTATLNNQTATATYTVRAGDIVAPTFSAYIGSINGSSISSEVTTTSAKQNDTFRFASITNVKDADAEDFTYTRELINPEGENTATLTTQSGSSDYTLTTSGTWTVRYTVTDDAGNSSVQNYYITVTSSSSSISTESVTTLSVVLIVVGVVLIAGIIIYLVRFRKRKAKN